MDNITPHDELAYIRKVMADSRSAFTANSKPSILWGAVIAIAMTMTYTEALTGINMQTGWIWLGLPICACIYMILFKSRLNERKARTLAGKINSSLWAGIGITLCIIISMPIIAQYVGAERMMSMLVLCPLTAAILGTAYFVSGVLYEMKWVQYVSFGWWAGAIIMFLVPSVHILGAYALMIIAFQIVPGIVMLRTSPPNDQCV